jgi:hypothetical protein
MFGLMICISGLNGAAQVPAGRGPDPQTQLLNNYRKYVDRYIRISDEAWKYDEVSHSATHSFTLKNNAGVAYSEIELRVNYLDAKGKPLRTQTLKIPGILAAYASRKFANLKARNISHDCDQAVLTISKATIHP